MFKIIAFIKKNFIIESSYKLAFFFNLFSVIATIFTYFFIDKMFGHKVNEHLEEFGVNYFSYVLLSMAFFSYIGVGIGSFSSRIRSEQMQGTLESLLLTPTKILDILLGMAVWNLIIASIDVMIYFALGTIVFGINFSQINFLSSSIILILTILTFSSLGILSASFTIVLKRGNPVNWVINTLEGLIGGVYFPVAVLPLFLQRTAQFFPITHAIRAMELSVYKGYSLWQLRNECYFLLIFSFILLPISFYSFKYALNKARIQGSLIQY